MHGSALRRGAVGAVVGPPDPAVRRLRAGADDRRPAARRRRGQREHAARQPDHRTCDPARGRSAACFTPCRIRRAPNRRCSSSARWTAASAAGCCWTRSPQTIRPLHPDGHADHRRPEGTGPSWRRLPHGRLGRRAGGALPAFVGLRLAQHLRGLRPAVPRSHGLRHGRRGDPQSRQPGGAGRRRVRADAGRRRSSAPWWPSCSAMKRAGCRSAAAACGAPASSRSTR